jgi:acyl-CoA thioesterase II
VLEDSHGAAEFDFAQMMALEEHGPDTFVGTGPKYHWGGLYGGQIVAQALRAAGLTVAEHFAAHSLHAYFIRRGDHEEPIRFEVDRVRNGRSFVTRRVIARQSVGAILSMEASFQVDEAAPNVQTAVLPAVTPPIDLVSDRWSPMFDRRAVRASPPTPGRAQVWMRATAPMGNDRLLQSCALAYMSDDIPTEAVLTQHPDRISGEPGAENNQDFMCSSLDHAIWFHRPSHNEGWHLHDLTCHAYLNSRGLAFGHVHAEDGTHVATVSQEVLVRKSRLAGS